MPPLQPLNLFGACFNIKDPKKFELAIALLRESVFDDGATMFVADNLITWNKTLSFLRDDFIVATLNDPNTNPVERSIAWRTYVMLYFAQFASKAPGDFVECGCHTGYTASVLTRKIDFAALDKKYYLYDLFAWNPGDEHTHLTAHDDPGMYEKVVERFKHLSFVQVIRGSVPQSFSQGFPDQIAFAHIDMNHPDPEAGALEMVLPRLSHGGAVIFDDYGWWGYSAQKVALDPIIARHGLEVLELPTGQALVLKP